MRKAFLIVLFACIAFSCEDEIYSPIPWTSVNFTLHLNQEDSELNGKLSCKTFTQARISIDRCGYGGLLVINAFGGNVLDLKAYDLSCPVEAQSDIRIKPDTDGQKASCPKCGAIYNISSGGAAISGSKHPLKQYRVTQSGQVGGTYVVTN